MNDRRKFISALAIALAVPVARASLTPEIGVHFDPD
jgi:hypothetical protein